MDLGGFRFDALHRDAVPAPLEYLRLIASLAAMQAASRTAAVEAGLATGPNEVVKPVDALVTLLAAAPGWAEAVTTLEGSFSPDVAGRRKISPP